MTLARNNADLKATVDLKSTTASPTFTGTPAAPTANAGTSTTQLATTAFASTGIANLIDSSPAALNTLNELAAAMGDDASFSTTVTNNIAAKVAKSGDTMTGTLTIDGTLNVAADTNESAQIGRAHIGHMGWSDYASFSHVDRDSATGYAINQASDGQTFINAETGKDINFGIGGVSGKMVVDGPTGNVGIGDTDPSEAKLSIVSTTNTVSGLQIYSDQGSSQNAPLVNFIADNTGFDQNVISIQNDGTGIGLYIDQNGAGAGLVVDGNVGIGTNSPSSPLGISKFLEIEHADNASLVLSETGTGDKWEIAHATSELRFYYHDGSNGDYRMVINALGNVGIGDATPEDAKLKVVNSVDGDMAGKFEQTAAQDCLGIFQTGAGTAMYISSASSGGTGLWINQATNNPSIAVTDGSNTSPAYSFHGDMDTGMYRQGDNLLSFATAGNERMRIDNNGHVGIGPSAPDSEMLEVYNTVANTYGITVFNGASANYAAINLDADGAGDGIEINQSGAGKSVNIINSTGGEGLKITHSASAVALNVASSSSGQWAATLANSNSSGHGVYIEGGSGSGETALQVDNTGGTNLLKIKSDSVFTINASSWGNSSDRRLKENIEYISASGTDLINSLKPCKFDMIEGENNQYGFIAQDVEPVLPEAVNVYDEETGMLSLKSGYIVPWLVKALQEANARISALENA